VPTQSLWLRWDFDPGVLLVLAALTAGYFWRVRRRSADEMVTRGQIRLFCSVIALLFLTLVSPLNALGNDYLFSAHILQAFLLSTACPPLLLLSLPDWLLNPLFRAGPLHRFARGSFFLLLATLLFNANFLLWLVPSLYDSALRHAPLHDVQSLLFLLTGVLNWWPLITPAHNAPRWPYPLQLLYLFLDGIPLGLVSVTLFFVDYMPYAVYAHAPRLWSISASADLQLGSIILYVPGLILDLIVLSMVFFKWLAKQEREAALREAAMEDEARQEAPKPA
jgi:cytochrome c oxidase assembly factor CtaG